MPRLFQKALLPIAVILMTAPLLRAGNFEAGAAELVNGGVQRYPGADYPAAPIEPALRSLLKTRYQFIFGLGNDELGYLIPKAEWDEQPPWLGNSPTPFYGEINSAGPDAAGAVRRALAELIQP